MPKPTILVIGGNGQLAQTLIEKVPEKFKVIAVSREEFDIADFQSVEKFFKKIALDYIINTAAYTAVDKAETEEAQAFLANAIGVYNLAKYAPEKTKIIHISTDFVFDGNKSTPFLPEDKTVPLNAYGRSKLAGEKLLLHVRPDSLIVRTSWLYSKHGKNFVNTMKRLMLEKGHVRVVNDQIGLPTNCEDLAQGLFRMINNYRSGIYHYSNTGSPISWYDFACEINKVFKLNATIEAISSSEYLTQATRPAFSALDKNATERDFDITIPDWKTSLQSLA